MVARRSPYKTGHYPIWKGVKFIYNITKAKRVLWLANSASTICPWVYAADVNN